MKALWRTAAGLCLAHLVLMLAGYSQQKAPRFTDDPAAVAKTYLTTPATPNYVGEFLAVMAFFLLLALVPLLATLLRADSPASRWLSGFVSASGIAYVVLTIGASFAPPAAAFYLAQHGGDPALVGALDRLGTFGTAASLIALGVFVVSIGAAALVSRALGAFIGVTGVGVGVFTIASVAGISTGFIDYGQLAFMVWFVVLAGAMVRRSTRSARALVTAPAA